MGIEALWLVLAATVAGAAPNSGTPPTSAKSPQAARLDLTWQGPPGCPSAEQAQALIEEVVDAGPVLRLREAVRARVVLFRESGIWSATIDIEPATVHSPRRLSGEDCHSVADASAFVVAMSLDLLDDGDEVSVDPESMRPQSKRPRVPQLQADTAVTRVRRGPRTSLRVFGGASAWTLPKVGPFVGLAVAVSWQHLRLELSGAHHFARWVPAPNPVEPAQGQGSPPAGANIRLSRAGVRACGLLSKGPVDLATCAGVAAGAMHGRARGLSDGRGQTRLWVGASVGPALTWHLGRRVGLWMAVDAEISLLRPGFHLQGLGSLHRTPPSGLVSALGFELRFS